MSEKQLTADEERMLIEKFISRWDGLETAWYNARCYLTAIIELFEANEKEIRSAIKRVRAGESLFDITDRLEKISNVDPSPNRIDWKARAEASEAKYRLLVERLRAGLEPGCTCAYCRAVSEIINDSEEGHDSV